MIRLKHSIQGRRELDRLARAREAERAISVAAGQRKADAAVAAAYANSGIPNHLAHVQRLRERQNR